MKYELLSGKHSRFEGVKGKPGEPKLYRKGDVIELSKEEAEGASLKGRIKPAGASKPEPKPTE